MVSKLSLLLLAAAYLLPAQTPRSTKRYYGTAAPLTAPSQAPARQVAREFLEASIGDIGITVPDLDSLTLVKEYRTAHNGVRHLVFGQQFQGLDVFRASWAVNVAPDGSVLNAGGNLYKAPAPSLGLPSIPSAITAARAAVAAVTPARGANFQAFQTKAFDGKNLEFHRGELAANIKGTLVWYPVNGQLTAAWKFLVVDAGYQATIAIVDPVTQNVLEQQALYMTQQPPFKGMVYDRTSPLPNPKPGTLSSDVPPLANRVIVPFTGDPVASPKGWVTGNETAGNNVIAGKNPLGIICISGIDLCPPRPQTTAAVNGEFNFPLVTGPGNPAPTLYADAVTTNLFYWANKAHDMFYLAGFDEGAGNFQQDNYGGPGAGGDPVHAYSQAGSAAQGQAATNNSFFGTFGDDGSGAFMFMFVNDGLLGRQYDFLTDDSLDAEVMMHEYTHGVSSRLATDLYTTFQGRAMGEAISDFFGLEFTVPDGAPADGSYTIGDYAFLAFGTGIRSRPYSTSTAVNPLTYANLGHVYAVPEVHADGEIFANTLWEMRANLIKQLGEKEARRRVRLLLIDGMKLALPAASMLDMRDGILLADRVDFKGESQSQIWQAFAKRGMGVLAQSGSANSLHIAPSFDAPSPEGSIRFYEDRGQVNSTLRIILQDSNNNKPTAKVTVVTSSGDVEDVLMRRQGQYFLGSIPIFYPSITPRTAELDMLPGDFITAFYTDEDTGKGAARQISFSAPTTVDYSAVLTPASFKFTDETGLRLNSATGGLRVGLPFDFPFFNKKYREAIVYANGLITFDRPMQQACRDLFALATTPAIAPMWMDMRTNGRAQPNEDVYRSVRPNSVTFRWAGETRPASPFQQPEPVNFAATLYDDGKIVYDYGSGNRNLGTGVTPGCGATPSVAISDGSEAFVEYIATHNGAGAAENFPTITWQPPLSNLGGPLVQLESPAEGDVISDVLTVRGIAYDVDGTVGLRRVDVIVDGIPMDPAAIGQSRTDFCATQQVPGCPGVGFLERISIDLLGLKPGKHTLEVQAMNRRGVLNRYPSKPVNFTIQAPQSSPAEGAIENITDGMAFTPNQLIRGYAYSPTLRVVGVDILVDGITYGRALYGSARPDICNALPAPRPPSCPNVGFTFGLSVADSPVLLPNGTHQLQVRTVDEAGRYTLIPATPLKFTISVNRTAPKGEMTTPRQNDKVSGTLVISGYAYSPGAKISRVLILLDGAGAINAAYGTPRAAACANLPDAGACPNIGFDAAFDSRRLSNGPHTVGALLFDDQGGVTQVPVITADGLNIIVQN